ncbi:MAG: heavy-metal-associated domain-containing protein [Bacteroidia bacterium]
MKKLAFIFGILLLTSLASNAQDKKNTTETITIKTSAVCDMCKNTLEKAMAYEKGVKKADLNVETKLFTITYNPKKTNPEKIKKAINKAGYDADDSPADPKAYENLHACCKKDSKH